MQLTEATYPLQRLQGSQRDSGLNFAVKPEVRQGLLIYFHVILFDGNSCYPEVADALLSHPKIEPSLSGKSFELSAQNLRSRNRVGN